MLWVALTAALGPFAVYGIALAVYSRIQRRRQHTTRPTVADITARLRDETREQDTQPTRGDTCPNTASAPPGYHWPDRDHDTMPELQPLRPRPYLIYSNQQRTR